MHDSDHLVTSFPGVATPETAVGITIQLPRGCLAIFTLRDAIIPLVAEVGFSTPHNMI